MAEIGEETIIKWEHIKIPELSIQNQEKTRRSDLKLGMGLAHETSGKTTVNLEVFQLRRKTMQGKRGGRGWRRTEGSKEGRGRRRSEGRETQEMNGCKEGKEERKEARKRLEKKARNNSRERVAEEEGKDGREEEA